MIADEEAYQFFIQNDTDLFSEKDAFDNKHGIMVYNRTDQEKGRATKYLPASEWIVSVGKHPGLKRKFEAVGEFYGQAYRKTVGIFFRN